MIAQSPLQLIVVGAGLIGPRHAQHIVDNSNTELLAIVDPAPAVAEICNDLSALYFKSLEDLFEYLKTNDLPLPQGAIICTPNHTHVTIAAELASKGIHLLIEKPVSVNVEEGKALREYTEKKNVKVLVGHHRRFNPYIIFAKSQLDKLGEVITFQGTWALKKPDSYFASSPWRTDVKKGGGAILINLVHDIDLLQYLFGPIEKVYAELLKKQRTDFPNADEGACLTLRFKNNITGTFICSDNVVSPFNFEAGTGENPLIPHDVDLEGFYRIFGSEGTLSVPDMTLYHQRNLSAKDLTWHKSINRSNLNEDKSSLNNLLPFTSQLEHFVDVLRGNCKPLCSIDDGISALLCVDAVARSIRTGQPAIVQTVDQVKSDFSAIKIHDG